MNQLGNFPSKDFVDLVFKRLEKLTPISEIHVAMLPNGVIALYIPDLTAIEQIDAHLDRVPEIGIHRIDGTTHSVLFLNRVRCLPCYSEGDAIIPEDCPYEPDEDEEPLQCRWNKDDWCRDCRGLWVVSDKILGCKCAFPYEENTLGPEESQYFEELVSGFSKAKKFWDILMGNKEILPLLIGVDPDIDKEIRKKLKE